MAIEEKDILSGDCLNGRIVVKVDLNSIREDLGLPRESKIIFTEPQEKAFAGASSKGVVIKMAADAFGQKYKENYGNEINPPKLGDILHFTPYQSQKMDKAGEYYLVVDEQVNFVQRTGAK